MTAEQLRQLEPDQLLRLLASQVSLGLDIIANNGLIEMPPKAELKGEPLLRIGDFTIYAREEKP